MFVGLTATALRQWLAAAGVPGALSARGPPLLRIRCVPYRAWLSVAVALSLVAALLVFTGPAQPWLVVVDAALAVALVGFLRAWRSKR
jgi:hypothetical protein